MVPSTGETIQEFNDLHTGVWDFVQPTNALSGMLADDLAATYWRLQRPRRCETAEIRRLRETARGRLHFEKISEVEALKSRFVRDFATLCSLKYAPTDAPALVLSLEETRKKLECKSLGLNLLIGLVETIEKRVNDQGYLSPSDERLLVHVCGVGDGFAQACLMLNRVAKAEMEKFEKHESSDKSAFEANKQIMLMRLKSKIRSMEATKQMVEQMESAEEDTYLLSLVMPPAERSAQICRAEAALSRRFFKTLALILALKGIESPP